MYINIPFLSSIADSLMQHRPGQPTKTYQDRPGQSHSELFRNGYSIVLFQCKKVFVQISMALAVIQPYTTSIMIMIYDFRRQMSSISYKLKSGSLLSVGFVSSMM